MEEFIHKTEKSIPGYWLIDEEAIKELDSIIEKSWSNMLLQSSQKIEDELHTKTEALNADDFYKENQNKKEAYINEHRTYLESRYSEKTKEIKIILSDSRAMKFDKLSDAAKNLTLDTELPIGVDIKLDNSLIKVEIKLKSKYSNDLTIQTTPETDSLSKDIFSELHSWANKYKPSKWEQSWDNLHGYIWIFFSMAFSFLVYLIPHRDSTYKTEIINNAHKLLENGITNKNNNEALEILLTLQTSYVPANKIITTPAWIGYLFFGLLAVAIIMSIKPKFSVAIGRGKTKVKQWKAWVKFISITIPSFIFLSVIVPKLIELL